MKHFCSFLFLISILSNPFSSMAQLCGNDTIALQHKWDSATGTDFPLHVQPDVQGNPYIYVAAQSGGLKIFDVSDENQAQPVFTMPVSTFSGLYVMYVEQDSNYLYLALGNFFGSNVQQPGMAIVDISDPHSPVMTDIWINSTVVKGSAIVKVQGNYAYLGAMTAGLIILNVANKSDIQFVSQYIPDINWPVVNPSASSTPNARGMQVIGNILYLCYDAGGLRIINVADKSNPFETDRYINPVPMPKQQAYNNITISNNLAYIGVDYCGMEILNVGDTANITQVGWYNPWNCQSITNIWINSHGHGNEVVYDAADNIVFLSCGASELRIVDVSNPAAPDSCSGYGTFTDTLAAWGVSVDADRVYLTYIFAIIPYVGVWNGIKMLKWGTVNGIKDLVEEKSLAVIPNPFHEQTSLQFSTSASGVAAVEIQNAIGQNILRAEINFSEGKNSIPLYLRNEPPGLYFLSLKINDEILHLKILAE